ncbi:MAG: sigma-54-dependent transcriptional regulator [Kiloniellaceae bacterium]
MAQTDRPRVLLVEDSPDLASLYREYLGNEPIELAHVATGRAALARLNKAPPAVLLLDLKLPDMDGRDILKHVTGTGIPTCVLVITGHGSIKVAVEAMQAGAYDFLAKPFKRERLTVTLRNALERQRLSGLVETYRKDFSRDRFMGLIGASLKMQAVYRILESAAASKATVFITGESGTGKELCAQAIHDLSARRGEPLIALNCGAIPRDLMESEIFGHVAGAFTGALCQRDGAASLADGGTLFLDEVCEMDPSLQVKLLRFVQTGSFRRVGGERTEKVDVRLLCATNQDALAAVEAGRLREDLYYRLHVIPLHLPPLREREDDILPIARHFLATFTREEGKRFASFRPEVEAVLTAYDWPGNVRQVQNVIRNIVVLHEGEVVEPAMLPPPLNTLKPVARPARLAQGPQDAAAGPRAIRPLWLVEKDAIESAIARCGGNVVKAAEGLEISPSTIYRKRADWTRDAVV